MTYGRPEQPDPITSEKLFQAQVMQLAAMYGWHVAHFRPSQTRDGRWLTAISGDAGFPDLVLAHPERGIVFAELKAPGGKLAPGQVTWLEKLRRGAARAVAVHLWRPADLDNIVALLSAPTTRNRPPATPAPSPSAAEAAEVRKPASESPRRTRPPRGARG